MLGVYTEGSPNCPKSRFMTRAILLPEVAFAVCRQPHISEYSCSVTPKLQPVLASICFQLELRPSKDVVSLSSLRMHARRLLGDAQAPLC